MKLVPKEERRRTFSIVLKGQVDRNMNRDYTIGDTVIEGGYVNKVTYRGGMSVLHMNPHVFKEHKLSTSRSNQRLCVELCTVDPYTFCLVPLDLIQEIRTEEIIETIETPEYLPVSC